MKFSPFEIIIKSSERYPDIISFPPEILKNLNLNLYSGDKLTLSAGCSDFNLTVADPNHENCCLISNNVMKKLGLYNGQRINMIQQAGDMMKIGPYFGVFVNIGSIKSISLGNPHQRLVELAKASIEEGAVNYFFSIRDINWPKYCVTGYCYNCVENTWQKLTFPLPDVFYDRGGGFLSKQLPVAKYIRKQLTNEERLQKLNVQHYFNKWKNHQILSQHKVMKPYLPDTILYENSSDIEKMVAKYNCVYLKANEGSNGRQVIRVKLLENTQYEINYFDKKVVNKVFDSIEEIIPSINQVFDSRSFIVQQGIDVLEYQGNNVDMRALLQRNGTGQWQITAVPVRIASNHCGITSTSTGSQCYQFDYAFEKLFHFNANQLEKIKRQVTELLYLTSRTIETEYGKFGELGIDLALDKQGKLWFIESNAKPGKDTILLSGNEDASRMCFLVPIQYTKYLTGFYGE